MNVELHYGVARAAAGVGHVNRYIDLAAIDARFLRAQMQVVVGKVRVAQPVAKGIQRRARQIPVA